MKEVIVTGHIGHDTQQYFLRCGLIGDFFMQQQEDFNPASDRKTLIFLKLLFQVSSSGQIHILHPCPFLLFQTCPPLLNPL